MPDKLKTLQLLRKLFFYIAKLQWVLNHFVIFVLGAISFLIATAGGVLFAKFMNLFLKKKNKLNQMIGAAGVIDSSVAAGILMGFLLKVI